MLTILTKLFRCLAMKTPLSLLYRLGMLIGLIMCLNPRKYRIAYKNIKLCFPEKSCWEIRQIVHRNFKSIGLSFIEMMIGPRLIDKVTIRGEENLEHGNHIFVGIHQANWELYNYALAARMKFAVLAKPQKPPQLNAFIDSLRRENNVLVCYGIKDLLRALQNNWTIGMVVDAGAEDNAPNIEFFNHLVPTPRTSLVLARKLGKKIYPCRGFRVDGFTHIIEIGKPIDLSITEDLSALRQINQYYENHIREHTWQYLWVYKRFKYKKNLNILLLNDGKFGHLKQTQAFISFLKETRFLISVITVDISYRWRLCRLLVDIIALITPRFAPKIIIYLSFLIDKPAALKLARIDADIVVSCGSGLASINRLIASAIYAKSVAILRPNIPMSKFDLCLIPAHDRVYDNNAVVLKGALTYPADIQEKAQECRKFFSIGSKKKLAVFIGGSVFNQIAFITNLKVFIKHLIDYSVKNDYKLLVSTSRRTPQEAEYYLSRELIRHPQIETLIIANKKNYDFVFEGFTALADMVFVTAESISMVSEIASMSKPCAAVVLETMDDKRSIFLQSLEKDIQILKNPYTISNIIFTPSKLFQENKAVVIQSIKKLL